VAEIKAREGFFTRLTTTFRTWQEYLRLRADNLKPKFLYLTGAYDPTNVLSPKFNAENIAALDQEYDVKYAVIDSRQDICDEVRKAARTGKLTNVLIEGLSDRNFFMFSEGIKGVMEKNQDFSTCFSGLEESGRIVLDSCNTGVADDGNADHSFAQILANGAKRVVVGTIDAIANQHIRILSKKPLMLFHPKRDDRSSNAYKVFFPSVKNKKDEL